MTTSPRSSRSSKLTSPLVALSPPCSLRALIPCVLLLACTDPVTNPDGGSDAGPLDAGPPDTGHTDAGLITDAGDAGDDAELDAGAEPDAGPLCAMECGPEEGCFDGTCARPPLRFLNHVRGADVEAMGRDDAGFLYVSVSMFDDCDASPTGSIGEVDLEFHTCSELAVAQIDAMSGTVNWVRQIWNDSQTYFMDMAVDANGNTTLAITYEFVGGGHIGDDPDEPGETGEAFPTPTRSDGMLVSFDSSGGLRWTRHLNGRGAVHSLALTADPDGDIFVVGTSDDRLLSDLVETPIIGADETGVFVLHLAGASGRDRRHTKLLGDTLGDPRVVFGGDALWVGLRFQHGGDANPGTAEIPGLEPLTNGRGFQVQLEIDPTTLSFESAVHLDGGEACDPYFFYNHLGANVRGERVGALGCEGGDAIYEDAVLASGPHVFPFTADGAPLSAQSWGTNQDSFDLFGLSMDNDGYFISGIGRNGSDYGHGPIASHTSPVAMLTRYDSRGSHLWSRRAPARGGKAAGRAVVHDGRGGAYWAVSVGGALELEDLSYTPFDRDDDTIILHAATP